MQTTNIEQLYELVIDQHETLEDHLENNYGSPALQILRNQSSLVIEMVEKELKQ